MTPEQEIEMLDKLERIAVALGTLANCATTEYPYYIRTGR